jgi:hypothetical protein
VKNPEVVQVIRQDRWSLARGVVEVGPYTLRFRHELPSIADTSGYAQLLTILWPYADQDSGTLPSVEEIAELEQFENRLSEALEHDGHAVIAAVLTLDGARQWVVYTDDMDECARRITNMPQNEAPYPIEMHAQDDPDWEYLRQDILRAIS